MKTFTLPGILQLQVHFKYVSVEERVIALKLMVFLEGKTEERKSGR